MLRDFQNKIMKDVLAVLFMTVVILVCWCWVYRIGSIHDLSIPNVYTSDGILTYAIIKAFSAKMIAPLAFKFIDTLNAPFAASWNDFPLDDFVYFTAGGFVSLFGLSAGTWLYLASLHLMAAYCFYFSSLVLRGDRLVSCACAVLFGLSPFAFFRNFLHLSLTVYWHVPLLLLSLLWAMDPEPLGLTRKQGLTLGMVSGVLAGLLNPYYCFLFLFLWGLVLAGALYRRERQRILDLGVVFGACLFVCVVSRGGFFLFSLLYGKGGAISRDLWGLVVFGLKIPDLITPLGGRFETFSSLFNAYRSLYPTQIRGEAQLSYVGFFAVLGLGALSFMGTLRIAARDFLKIDNLYWLLIGLFSFAVVGGVNYLLGAFGFLLLRCTNRYSIVLMAMGLLFIVKLASRIERGWMKGMLAIFILCLGLYDQLPGPVPQAAKELNEAKVIEDRSLARALQSALPPGSMVFQLPIKEFPETGVINTMEDYDHFRPWLWTKGISYSYGTLKGRSDAEWQRELAYKPLKEMTDELNCYGFSAVLINRSAYTDSGEELKGRLSALGYLKFVDQPCYLAFRLKPSAQPRYPAVTKFIASYPDGFHDPERDTGGPFRWGNTDSVLVISRNRYRPRQVRDDMPEKVVVAFDMQVISPRSVWIQVGPERKLVFSPQDSWKHLEYEFSVKDLPVTLRFHCDPPAMQPGNADSRKLAYQVRSLTFK